MKEVWIIWFKVNGKGKWYMDRVLCDEADACWLVKSHKELYPDNKYKIVKYVKAS